MASEACTRCPAVGFCPFAFMDAVTMSKLPRQEFMNNPTVQPARCMACANSFLVFLKTKQHAILRVPADCVLLSMLTSNKAFPCNYGFCSDCVGRTQRKYCEDGTTKGS